jgi:hypothetical protein
MGQLETADADSYETRELAWELQQAHPDQQRIKFFLDNAADLRSALRMANMAERDLMKRPALRPLVQRHLHSAQDKNSGL